MAHELTHVANRDVLVMTLAGFFATIAAYIVQFGFFFGGGSMDDDDDNPSFMVLLLVSLVVYVVSFLLMQALSRYREFAADRGAALITGRRARWPRRWTRSPAACTGSRRRTCAPPASCRRSSLPGQGQNLGPVLDAPADGEADRGAPRLEAQLQGQRGVSRWASSTSFAASASSSSPRPTACSRCRPRT